MNRAAYRHVFATYGKSPSVWFGYIGEFVRAIINRVVTVLVLASMAAAVAVGDFARARDLIVLWGVLTLFGAILAIIGDLFAHRAENLIYVELSKQYYRKMTGKDMRFYRNSRTGYLTTVFRHHLDSILNLNRWIRGQFIRTSVSLTFPVIVMAIIDWRIGVVSFLMLLIQSTYILWSSARANKYRLESHKAYREASGEVSDVMTNILAYKSAGNEESGIDRYRKLADYEAEVMWKRRSLVAYLNLPRAVLTTILVAAAFWVALDESLSSEQVVQTIVLTITYIFGMVRNIDDLPEIIVNHDNLVTQFEPTLEILREDNETITDKPNAKNFKPKDGTIDIERMSFTYREDHGNVHVFDKLDMHVRGGERVGVVGLSGSGKTTLANLIMRFDDVESGAIKIDGQDVRDVTQSQLRANIAYVPQEPILFHRSVRENITFGHPSANDKDVRVAAKAAHAHEFIKDLPNGYDTIVGERGVKLSGGQKQRVVIARAVLSQAPILLFDEATSALDSESESIIRKALPEIIGSHTAIIIAHRLSTVAGLDRIVVMHRGKIVEEGTHDQLLKLKGRYYKLWQKQISDKI